MICPRYKAAAIGALISVGGVSNRPPHPTEIISAFRRREWLELMSCDKHDCQQWHDCQGRK